MSLPLISILLYLLLHHPPHKSFSHQLLLEDIKPSVNVEPKAKRIRYVQPINIDVPKVVKAFPELSPMLRSNSPHTSSQLNWGSVADINKNAKLLSQEQLFYIRNILAFEEQIFPTPHHLSNAMLLAASAGSHYESICSCISFNRHRYLPCNRWKLCPQCAHSKRREALQALKPLYRHHKVQTHFLAITAGILDYSNRDAITTAWDAMAHVIKNLARTKKFKGCLYVEELAVHSYINTTGVIHAHAMFITDDIHSITSKLIKAGYNINEPVRPNTVDDYENEIRYLFKSIRLNHKYQIEWDTDNAEAVNGGLQELMTTLDIITAKRKSVRHYGIIKELQNNKD